MKKLALLLIMGWIPMLSMSQGCMDVSDEDGVTVIAYEHIVVLHDVVLKSGDESLIFNDTYLFGVFQTSI